MVNIRLISSKGNIQDWILQANVGKNVKLSSDMEINGHDISQTYYRKASQKIKY